MRIDGLSQNADYEFIFPVQINGVNMSAAMVESVSFGIFTDEEQVVLLDSINTPTQVSIVGEQIVIRLTAVNTVSLSSAYKYELWIKSISSENFLVRAGDIIFSKTLLRV